jgi:hypothetical protein
LCELLLVGMLLATSNAVADTLALKKLVTRNIKAIRFISIFHRLAVFSPIE